MLQLCFLTAVLPSAELSVFVTRKPPLSFTLIEQTQADFFNSIN